MKFLLIIILTLPFYYVNGAVIPRDNEVILNLGRPGRNALASKQIKMLVWNLHKGESQDFEKDFTSLAWDKDLILSQEILLNSEMKRIFAEFPEFLFQTATSFYMGKNLNRTGVAIASQAPVLRSHFIRTKNLEPFTHSPKITLITQYGIENQTEFLTIINVHAINFVTATIFAEEMDHICQVVESLDILNHPLVFAGDFNTWSEERVVILNNLKNKLRLKEAQFSPDYRLTFHGFALDHVLYSSHLSLISAKADRIYQGSDHRPLELVFNLQNSR
jgi:endonuclease/exonuclease/phosphatase (EEP) superfamily protein YafD